MVQKPIAISVIAAVTVAGILMLAILAAISSANQAFAQAKSTILSLGSSPTRHVDANTDTLPLFGKLTSDHSPVDGASIIITGTGEGKQFSVTTNQLGSYSTFTHLGPGTHKIEAYFAGNSDHTSSTATRVVTVKA
ncbi:MAG: carboxypeptidase-like regulatory domain-containing protein [Candidatus Nitrosopolaris sp.]